MFYFLSKALAKKITGPSKNKIISNFFDVVYSLFTSTVILLSPGHNANVLKYLLDVIASVFHLYTSEAFSVMPLLQHKIPFACIQISGVPVLEAAGWDSPQLRFPPSPRLYHTHERIYYYYSQ